MQVWRLASAVDSLKFKIVPDQAYYFQAGHRYWAKGNTAAATQSGNSDYLSFQFDGAIDDTIDGATSTILGLGALASSIVLSMLRL